MQHTRTISAFDSFGRSGSHWLLEASALLFLFVGPLRQAQAQGCDNSDNLYAGGLYCIAATTGWSGNNPEMPQLTYQGNGDSSSCDAYTYIVELDFAQPGDTNADGESYGLYNSTDEVGYLAGNVPWIVNWSLNDGDAGEYSEGGNGWIDIYLNGSLYDGFAFNVWGQNPTTGSAGEIAMALNGMGPPWWFGHALTQESSNQQFITGALTSPTGEYFGTPVWGYPDGFGLAQVDGVGSPGMLTDDVMWTWTTNLSTGIYIANQKSSSAQTYISNQAALMVNTLQSNGIPPANYPNYYPAPENYSSICSFSYPGSGNGAYWNLEWMTEYNGGYWTQWQASSLSWPIIAPLACNANGVCTIYAYTLCTNQSLTI